jgi:N-acetylglucosaminyldiphosphoundecaprenol N-acetyl-beta-D-mannosaminyltransferase
MTTNQTEAVRERSFTTRGNILGVLVSTVNMPSTIQTIGEWISHKTPNYVCVTPAHGVMDCQKQPELKQIFNNSGLTTPDGMAIVWLLKFLGHKEVSRVYGPDLMLALCEKSLETGWSHFFYGGAPGVADQLAYSLCLRFPGLNIAGNFSPPYRSMSAEEDFTVIKNINGSNADILWVGISTPKQEIWMAEHVGKLKAPVLIGVGAAFDFLSGTKKQAPKWMQRSGLEWLFRLATEPQRLWRRYLQYPYFALLVVAQLTGIKKYPLL